MFAAIAFALPLLPFAHPQAKISATVIEHVRVIDGTGRPPIENVTVLLEGGKIAFVGSQKPVSAPKNAKTIDATGQTLIPGLINAHGHLGLVDGARNSATAYTEDNVLAALHLYERYGVTTMLSLGGNRDLIYPIRAKQRAGSLDGASVFVADRGIGVPDGAPPLPLAADQIYRPATPEEARRDVQAAASRHTDFIKIWVDSLGGAKPKMQPAIYEAVIDEAHRQHIPVAAHVYELADAKLLVNAGVDVLAHSVRDTTVDQELMDAMKQRGTFYLPTFTVDESFFVFADHPEITNDPFLEHAANPAIVAMLRSDDYRRSVEQNASIAQHRKDFSNAQHNLKLLHDAGIKVGFGTDSGAMPTRIPGYAEHRELELMVAAGLTPIEAIHSATQVNAQLLQIAGQTGTIAVGKQADLILLAANPVDNIQNTRKIVRIWHNGREVEPAIVTK
ncbi:MAG TPA: amidohydrolase family protein [Alloacidobacterium sp.]|jgi:imidazolonepropionase-like amidohydrolase|nr:amidohydrolase family protein [Alloacidobacterium sp.]